MAVGTFSFAGLLLDVGDVRNCRIVKRTAVRVFTVHDTFSCAGYKTHVNQGFTWVIGCLDAFSERVSGSSCLGLVSV